jgi:hypothetical protein
MFLRRRRRSYWIVCGNEECPLGEYGYTTPQDAIESWNESAKKVKGQD